MVIVLGIHPGHDAGASLIKDGKIIAAVDEERFTRKKHWGGGFPKHSVKFVLDYAHIDIGEINAVAIPSKNFGFYEKIWLGLRYVKYPSKILEKIKKSKKGELGFDYFSSVIRNGLVNEFGLEARKIPIKGVDHHLAHASATYFTSGLKDPIIVTLDGVGGGISASISKIKKGKIKRISSSLELGSLGHFYEALTEGLGFLINNGEYKVMGLAPYGDWKPAYNELRSLAPVLNGLKFYHKPWMIQSKSIDNFWAVHLGETAYVKLLIDKYGNENVAAAGQRILEELITKWIRNAIRKTGKRNVVAAGGVFLNVKANKRIREMPEVNEFFAFPHSGDGGLSVGSALYVNQMLEPRTKFEKIESLSLGPEYTDEEIEKELGKHKELKYKKSSDVARQTGDFLAKGKIIGWFQGRMEFGPRALGNRSILASSSDGKYRDKINSEIKFREEWRPFTPSMLAEAKNEYLIGAEDEDGKFMIMSFDVPKDKIKQIPAVVHVDGTARPQLVTKETNELYYNMLKEFEKKSKRPCILNTSFNRKGEPVVCSPEDAVNTFLSGGIDYLVIGNFIVEKKNKGLRKKSEIKKII